jgi:hypothetical protein
MEQSQRTNLDESGFTMNSKSRKTIGSLTNPQCGKKS